MFHIIYIYIEKGKEDGWGKGRAALKRGAN